MATPKVLCVIPARLQSTRLAEKALQLIGGKPMVQLTYEAACLCPSIDKVVVATDHTKIKEVIEACGGCVEMTDADIKTGSDRVAVVAARYPEMDVIINLQGDEPFIKPEMLTELCEPFMQDENIQMATLAYDLDIDKEHADPSIVKVIRDLQHNAIYFSRSAIPFPRTQVTQQHVLHHMGTYGFRREFLKVFCGLAQTPLEQAESLEQLRAIEHGYKIHVKYTRHKTLEINTPEELARARDLRALDNS